MEPTGSAYDYHRSLRLHARHYLHGQKSLVEVVSAAERIKRAPERSSATAALERLGKWRGEHSEPIIAINAIVFESPSKLFKVKFEPDFGLRADGKTTAFHIWNTKKPPLAYGPTYAAMTLISQAYSAQADAPDDIAVLSLREPPRLLRLSDVSDQSRQAAFMVEQIENELRSEPPPPETSEYRPTA